ncbi:MAG: hypothetical protein ACOCRK_04485 [bacterium]
MQIVNINQEVIKRCYDFANEIINTNNQYNRLPATIDRRIERTFVGKLAEYSFLLFLKEEGINYPEGDMFQIFNGQENVDNYDFITNNGNAVDIKSASKPNHRRIMVPIDQFNNIPKDYYVGIKLNTEVTDDDKIIINSIQSARIYGYCTYQSLQQTHTRSFGEGPCKHMYLNRLHNIYDLIRMF